MHWRNLLKTVTDKQRIGENFWKTITENNALEKSSGKRKNASKKLSAKF